jgi:outer membrane murein-binding lipoprotein Lpp
MSAVCLWCESEGRGRPRETPGLCLVHRFEAVMASTTAAPEAGASTAFLIVVARNEATLFHRVSEWFLDDPRVRVIVDRRRRERRERDEGAARERRREERRSTQVPSDDLRGQPAVILALPASALATAVAAGGEERERSGSMDGAEIRERLERWLRESRDLADHVLPLLYRRTEIVRDRVDAAERDGRRQAARVTELETEVTRLRAEIHELRRDRDLFVENIERAMTEVTRMTSRFAARTRAD